MSFIMPGSFACWVMAVFAFAILSAWRLAFFCSLIVFLLCKSLKTDSGCLWRLLQRSVVSFSLLVMLLCLAWLSRFCFLLRSNLACIGKESIGRPIGVGGVEQDGGRRSCKRREEFLLTDTTMQNRTVVSLLYVQWACGVRTQPRQPQFSAVFRHGRSSEKSSCQAAEGSVSTQL